MPVEIDIHRFLALLELHRLGIKTRRHAHARPQAIASVHENKPRGRLAVGGGQLLRRIHQRHSAGAEEGLLQEISTVVHGCSLLNLR